MLPCCRCSRTKFAISYKMIATLGRHESSDAAGNRGNCTVRPTRFMAKYFGARRRTTRIATRTVSTMAEEDDFAQSLEAQRKYLLRYAQFHLRDPALAEDAVQDTILAALAQRAGFQGRSQLRTWLTGILKHKIIDLTRSRGRPSKPWRCASAAIIVSCTASSASAGSRR